MATDDKKEAIRNAVMADSYQYGIKQRFGLFSQPVSTAIGDNNVFKKKTRNVDEDGRVITGPRNFYTTGLKVGKTDKQLFSRPTYNAIGDPFKMAAIGVTRTSKKDGHLAAGHDKNFVAAKLVNGIGSGQANSLGVKPSYPYMPLGPGPKKSFKDEEGAVVTGPRNITVVPGKLGKVGKNVLIGEKIPYIEDDYNIAKKLAKKELEYHHSMVQEKPFSQKARHTEFFNNHRKVYEENPRIPERKKPEPPAQEEGKEPLHDKPFKPSNPARKGKIKGTLDKFPEYLPNPPTELKRKVVEEGEEEDAPPGFKVTHRYKSRPTPSVATNYRNLKASYPMAFAR